MDVVGVSLCVAGGWVGGCGGYVTVCSWRVGGWMWWVSLCVARRVGGWMWWVCHCV